MEGEEQASEEQVKDLASSKEAGENNAWLTGLPRWHSGKESAQRRRHKRCGFNPWVGKIPGAGNGNPLQYSCLENSKDGGAWWATVHGVTKSWALLSN